MNLLAAAAAATLVWLVATVRLEKVGPVPIRFEIPYDPAKIDERHSYAVRARILRGGRLLFTTDTVHSVLTRGAGTEAELLLVRSRAKVEQAAPAPPSVPLESTHWKLVELAGEPLPADPGDAVAALEEGAPPPAPKP